MDYCNEEASYAIVTEESKLNLTALLFLFPLPTPESPFPYGD
jgi:hypothetical protein